MKAHPGKERGESDAPSGGPVLGLALGGGALLGLAHIGVLEVFEQAGIRPRVVTGTSVGALIGACYAGGMSLSDMKATARSFSWRRVRIPHARGERSGLGPFCGAFRRRRGTCEHFKRGARPAQDL